MSKTAKAGRAQNVEELFASVSTIQASGLNPPPQRIILTPRSAESCLKHGINPESLRIRDLDSFRESSIDPAIQRMRHEAYSQRRHEYMKTVRTARKKLYAAEGKPAATSTVVAGGSDNSAMIDIEQRRLQKIQQRQQKEIENMLQFELKMNEVAEEASRKADGDSKREAKMEADKMMRNKQMAEERRVRDLKKKAQEDTEEEQRQRVAYAMFLKDKEQAEAQARKKRLMEIEARAREEERKRKAEEYRLETEAILKAQQDAIVKRLEEMDKAEAARSELILEQRKEERKQVEMQRKIVDKRIKQNLKQAREIEYKRKEDFDLKQMQVGEQRERLEFQAEQERMLARKQQELLARKRQMVLEETRYEEEMRKEELLARQEAMEENLQRIQAGQNRKLMLRKEMKSLNHSMKRDNVERMKRVDEYKRLETIRKLKDMEERTQRIGTQKASILQQRKEAGIHAKIQRDNIVFAMEEVKKTKKWSTATKTLQKAMGGAETGKKKKKKKGFSSTGSLPQLGNTGDSLSAPPTVSKEVAARVQQNTSTGQDFDPSPFQSPYEAGPQVTV